MSLWKAFRDGIATATRIPAPLIVMFLVTLIGALVLTVPVYAAMNAWVGHRLIARDLARDFDGWLLLEPLISGLSLESAAGTASAQGAAATLLMMVEMASLAWLTSSLPNAAFGGGVLLSYVEGRFAWRRFLWGAWHWLSSLVILSILFALFSALVVALGAGSVVILEAARVSALTIPALAVMGLVYVALMMAFEYARVIAIADGTRNIFRALRRAVAFIVRQPVRTFGLYVLMTALGLVLIPLYAGVVAPIIPFEWVLIAVAAQQFFIVARSWTRLARWASEVALYQQKAKE
jgi:hypothetical protein